MLQSFGGYAIPLVLFLLEILLSVVLLNGFWRLQRKNKKKKSERTGEKLYEQAIVNGGRQAHILMRREDAYPLFITENIKDLLGITVQDVRNNHLALGKVLGRNVALEMKKTYSEWAGEGVLSQEFFHEESGHWMRLEVLRVLDDNYDFVSFEDINEKKDAILSLEKKLALAEEESQSKTTFLSRMSHEIRTPMNGIIGMISLTQKNMKPDEEIEGYLQKASELSQYLLSLINDILDMSRIEAGKIELTEDVIDLQAMAEQLTDMFKRNVEAAGVSFVMEMLDFDVRYVIGDELRLMQTVVNFLSNAVKFTKEGEIRVTFRQLYHTEEQVDFMIRVHDTGKGMDPEFVNRIFKPFEQENAGVTKKYGGTGLGMAITDQIIQLMGGEIVIDSFPGRGSDFTIYLKLPIAEEPDNMKEVTSGDIMQSDIPEDMDLSGIRILLAEDNEINAEIAISILEMEGMKIDHAENGRIAVEKFAANPPDYYDVILMDIQMPEMNGIEAAKAIRGMTSRDDAGDVLIIALSADAFVEDQRRAVAAGMDEHLAKPIDFDQLIKTIARLKADKGMSDHGRKK